MQLLSTLKCMMRAKVIEWQLRASVKTLRWLRNMFTCMHAIRIRLRQSGVLVKILSSIYMYTCILILIFCVEYIICPQIEEDDIEKSKEISKQLSYVHLHAERLKQQMHRMEP